MSLLRINSDTDRVVAQRNVARSDVVVSRAMERLSSGSRINRASDDAAGLVISEHLRGQIRGFAQDQRNIQDGVALVETAEGALASVHSMLQRIRELAVQYKNGNETSDSNVAALQSEVLVVASEIERLGQRSTFNGIRLLDAPGAITFQVGATDGEAISIATISLGQVLGTDWATLGDDTDLAEIDAAIDSVSAQRGALGAVQNRLEHTLDALSNGQLNMVAAESRIRDVDMAEEAVNLARGQILSQAGTSLLAQANQANQGVLTLLR